MSKRDELIEVYTEELQKIGAELDAELLKKVVVGLGPSIYNKDSSTVAGSDKSELATVKNNFLVKKLGLEDSDSLYDAIDEVIEQYGRSNPKKYRAVVYYLLVLKFAKQDVYA